MTEEIRLNASKLGTQEYWNNFYKKEQSNFNENDEDTGECWFDDSDAEAKMIQFILEKLTDEEFPTEITSLEKISFLDLGTGNGHLLFELSNEIQDEYDGDKAFEYIGIDYSPDSVQFAQAIAAKKYNEVEFKFSQVDLLSKESPFLKENHGKFDVLLDKGTLDAIALNQDPIEEFDGLIGMDIYARQVEQLMHQGSILLITSCNFTEVELTKIITSNTKLSVWDKINYPSFQFGGVKGSTVCSIAFIKD
ncbi:EFM4 [[Candida] subhashii]|uniref:Protein-lysine N-methyltransferase EFM4 n=1 Tax=[Candida] subhashii TaxID=561895 RepID=A0A8J5QNN9_9ASCO|nr:EFM4 [[Candida] subhashii]KAG7666372.1 EFM4 [[Candida] subhashii]